MSLAMIFERFSCKPIPNPSATRIAGELARVRMAFATLTADSGAYLQVGGGPGLFVLEYRDQDGQQWRASQQPPRVPFPDGTVLSFAGSEIRMAQEEWFVRDQVTEIFATFLANAETPTGIKWRRLDYVA